MGEKREEDRYGKDLKSNELVTRCHSHFLGAASTGMGNVMGGYVGDRPPFIPCLQFHELN